MRYISGLINLIISLIVSTIIIYAINFIAGFAGADYSFTNGEVFVIWILMAILVNNCFNKQITSMSNVVKTDDVIFNFFKQICDEKDDKKCVELGNSWINAMETNLTKMEANLEEKDKIKHKDDIQSNRDHLNSLKKKNSSEWREYATKCMIEIMDNKV